MAFSFVQASVNDQSPEQTLAVATYELGATFGSLCQGIPSNASAEFADFVSMLRMFCEQRLIDFAKISPEEYADVSENMGLRGSVSEQLFAAFGRVVQCQHYDQVYGAGNHRHGPMDKRIGHLVFLCLDFCRMHKWNFWELQDLGEERYTDRMQDILKYGLSGGVRK